GSLPRGFQPAGLGVQLRLKQLELRNQIRLGLEAARLDLRGEVEDLGLSVTDGLPDGLLDAAGSGVRAAGAGAGGEEHREDGRKTKRRSLHGSPCSTRRGRLFRTYPPPTADKPSTS